MGPHSPPRRARRSVAPSPVGDFSTNCLLGFTRSDSGRDARGRRERFGPPLGEIGRRHFRKAPGGDRAGNRRWRAQSGGRRNDVPDMATHLAPAGNAEAVDAAARTFVAEPRAATGHDRPIAGQRHGGGQEKRADEHQEGQDRRQPPPGGGPVTAPARAAALSPSAIGRRLPDLRPPKFLGILGPAAIGGPVGITTADEARPQQSNRLWTNLVLIVKTGELPACPHSAERQARSRDAGLTLWLTSNGFLGPWSRSTRAALAILASFGGPPQNELNYRRQ